MPPILDPYNHGIHSTASASPHPPPRAHLLVCHFGALRCRNQCAHLWRPAVETVCPADGIHGRLLRGLALRQRFRWQKRWPCHGARANVKCDENASNAADIRS